MGNEWIGSAELARAAARAFGSPAPVTAVAVVAPRGEMVATAGCDDQSSFEIGSISKVLTGMVYRDVTERGLI
jgi:CubicO group peptidase (beta-lactamase class C family)